MELYHRRYHSRRKHGISLSSTVKIPVHALLDATDNSCHNSDIFNSYCRSGKNRTPIYGFGDRTFTINLHSQEALSGLNQLNDTAPFVHATEGFEPSSNNTTFHIFVKKQRTTFHNGFSRCYPITILFTNETNLKLLCRGADLHCLSRKVSCCKTS